MSSIDERVVDMRFNNGEFEKGIKESMKSLEDLKKALELDKATESLDSLDKAVNSMNFDALSRSVDAIADKFSFLGIVGVRAMSNIADKAIHTAESIAKSLTVDQIFAGKAKYEQKTEAVQTMKAATGLDINEIEEVLERLNWYTDWTSFDFVTMTKTIGQFVNSGVDLHVAEQAIEGIGNAAGLAGASIQNANHAMYNFAQALSSGAVRLQDWKSIEIANMDTKVFKETVIDTAIEMGVLQKAGEHVGTTVKGTRVDFQNFRNTLSEAWFTSDVLTETLMRFADQEEEVGRQGFEAAKVTISMSQAITAIKDALSSGWMKTFQLIFGNFDEASKLFSDITDAVIDSLAPIAEWRNGILEAWRALAGREMLIEGLGNMFGALWNIVLAVKDALWSIFPEDSVLTSLSQFTIWIYNAGLALQEAFGVTEIQAAAEAMGDLADGIGLVTDELTGNMDASVGEVKDWAKGVDEATEDITKDLEDIRELSQNVSYGMANDDVKQMQEWLMEAGYALDKYGADGVYGPETQAALKKFQEDSGLVADGIFGPKSFAAMQKTLSAIRGTTEEVEKGEDTIVLVGSGLQKLQGIAKGLFSIFHIGGKALKFGLGVVSKVVTALAPLGNVVLSIASVAGNFLAALEYWIDQSGVFEYALAGVGAALQPIADLIELASYSFISFLDVAEASIYAIPDFLAILMESFKGSDFFKYLTDKITAAEKTINQIKMAFNALKHVIFDGEFYNAGKGNEWLGPIMTNLLVFRKRLLEGIESIKTFFQTFDYSGAGKFLLETFSTALTLVAAAVIGLFNVVTMAVPFIVAGFEFVRDKAIETYESISEYFSNSSVVKSVQEFFRSLFPNELSKGEEELSFFDQMVSVLQGFQTTVMDLAKTAPDKINAFAKRTRKGFNSLYKALFEGKLYKPGKGNEWLEPIIIQLLRLRHFVLDTARRIKEFGSTVKDIFGEVRAAFVEGVTAKSDRKWLQPILDLLVRIHDIFGPIIEDIESFFSGLKFGFGEVPRVEGLSFFDRIGSYVDLVKGKFQEFLSAFDDDFSLSNIYQTIKSWVSQVWTGFVEAIKEYFLGQTGATEEDSNIVRIGYLVSANVMSDMGNGFVSNEDTKSLTEKAKDWLLARLNALGTTIHNVLSLFATTVSNLIPVEWKDAFTQLRSALITGEYKVGEHTPTQIIPWLEAFVKIHNFIKTYIKPAIDGTIEFLRSSAPMLWRAFGILFHPEQYDQNMREDGDNYVYTVADRLSGFADMFTAFKNTLKEAFAKVDLQWVTDTLAYVVKHFGFIAGILSTLYLTLNFSKLVGAAGNLLNSFNSKWEPFANKVLKFAASFALIALAMKIFSTIREEDLWKGYGGLAACLGVFVLISKLDGPAKSLKHVAEFFSSIGDMVFKIAGSVGIIAVLAFVVGFLLTIPGGADIFWKGAGALAIIAAGLTALMIVMAGVSGAFATNAGGQQIDMAKIGKGLMRVTLSLGLIVGYAVLLGEYLARGKGDANREKLLEGAKWIGGFAVGLLAMTTALAGISKLSSSKNGKASNIDKITKQLIAIVGAIGIMIAATMVLGNYPRGKLIQGGIAVAALSSVLTIMLAVLNAASSGKDKKAIKNASGTGRTLALMVGAVAGVILLADKAKELGSIPWQQLLQGGVAIAAFAVVLDGMTWLLSKIAKEFDITNIDNLIGSIVMLAAVVGALYLVIEEVKTLTGVSESTLYSAAALIGAIGVVVSVMSGIGALIGQAGLEALMYGAVGMLAFGAVLAVLVEVFSKIALGNLDLLSGVLEDLGSAISSFYDKISGVSFGEGSKMEQATTFLNDFLDICSKATFTNVANASLLGGAFASIGWGISQLYKDLPENAAELYPIIRDTITNIETLIDTYGTDEMDKKARKVATAIAHLASAFDLYNMGAAVKFDEDGLPILPEISNSEKAGSYANGIAAVFSEIAKALPEDADILAVAELGDTGTERGNSLALFATGVNALKLAIQSWAKMSSEISGSSEAIETAIGYVEQFEGIDEKLNKTNSVWPWLNAERRIVLASFATNIGVLGDAIGSFAENVGGLGIGALAKMELGIMMVDQFAKLYSSLNPDADNTTLDNFLENNPFVNGGILGVLYKAVDDNSAQLTTSDFSAKMQRFGEGLSSYYDAIGNRGDWDNASESTKVLEALAKVYRWLPEAGGALAWLFGDNIASSTEFASNMGNLGAGVVAFDEAIGGHEFSDNLKQAGDFIVALGEILKPLSLITESEPLGTLGNDMERFAAHFMNTVSIFDGKEVPNVFAGIEGEVKEGVAQEMLTYIQTLLGLEEGFDKEKFSSMLTEVGQDIQGFYSSLTEGTDTSGSFNMIYAVIDMLKSANTELMSDGSHAILLGKNIMAYIANGMYVKIEEIMPTRMSNIITSLNTGITDNVESIEGIGKTLMETIANGITNNSNLLEEALRTAIDSIDMLAVSLDEEGKPKLTLEPVIDMTKAQEQLSSLMGSAVGVDGALTAGALASQVIVMSDNSDVVTAISALGNQITAMASAMSNLRVIMDSGALVGAIAPGIDRYIGQQLFIAGRG